MDCSIAGYWTLEWLAVGLWPAEWLAVDLWTPEWLAVDLWAPEWLTVDYLQVWLSAEDLQNCWGVILGLVSFLMGLQSIGDQWPA